MVCVAHSNMSFDGQPLEEGKELLALVVKDSQQKGFFIRVVDPEVRGTRMLQCFLYWLKH